jgi:S-formylglutathione hydrolase FrmB
MIWTDFHFFSQSLGIQTAVYVLLPELAQMMEMQGAKLPTLYLLHGSSDDHTGWLRNTRIADYARKYRVAVVMPAVNRSFYTDMVHGGKYWTFVRDELPSVMETYFPLSRERAGRFAAGLSMGGYGAMKLGLLAPDRYAAVAALSAPLWLHASLDGHMEDPDFARELNDIFGSREGLLTGEGNLTLAAETLSPDAAPHLYACCGTADFLYEANEAFIAAFGQKLNITYVREPEAAHTWDYWDKAIRDVLAWLKLETFDNVW